MSENEIEAMVLEDDFHNSDDSVNDLLSESEGET